MEAEAAAAGTSEVTVSTDAAPAKAEAEPIVETPVSEWGVAVNDLDWSYPSIDGSPIVGTEPLIKDMDLKLKPGSCCLLLGANGAGKTTLLKILGGKHMVPKGKVLIHGREAFYDTALTTSGQLSYIGGNWQRDVAFAGYGVTLAGDFPAKKMLDSVPGVDPERKKRIIEVLDINPEWRMHQVSDGQRRRVQLALRSHDPLQRPAPRRDRRRSRRPRARGSHAIPPPGVRGAQRHHRVRDAHL